MLAALLIVFFGFVTLGGSEGFVFGTLMTDQIEKQIEMKINDKARRNSALERISEVEETLEEINEQTTDDLTEMETLIKTYNSTPDDFDQFFAKIKTNRQKQLNSLWNSRQKVLLHINPVEWQAIVTDAKIELQKDKE